MRCRLGHRALHGGVRLPCTACTFWHRPTPDGAGAMHALSGWSSSSPWRLVLFVAVLVAACVVAAIDLGTKEHKQQDHEGTACVFAMSRSNVAFAPLRGDACVVASTDAGVFGDGPIPIGAETKALLCVVNAVGVRVKVQLVAKEADDVFSVRTNRVS